MYMVRVLTKFCKDTPTVRQQFSENISSIDLYF